MGYVTQIVDGYGLNYNTATSVDVLMDRFAPYGTFFFESESASMTSSRGVYYDANLMNTGSNSHLDAEAVQATTMTLPHGRCLSSTA